MMTILELDAKQRVATDWSGSTINGNYECNVGFTCRSWLRSRVKSSVERDITFTLIATADAARQGTRQGYAAEAR